MFIFLSLLAFVHFVGLKRTNRKLPLCCSVHVLCLSLDCTMQADARFELCIACAPGFRRTEKQRQHVDGLEVTSRLHVPRFGILLRTGNYCMGLCILDLDFLESVC
ncbi:hypothetical protein ABW21_db0205456 [Orbilia brochopaga]|nr:hypothetical protein ABW21_db0205456 [Drechslerella brochopaga]